MKFTANRTQFVAAGAACMVTWVGSKNLRYVAIMPGCEPTYHRTTKIALERLINSGVVQVSIN